MYANLQIQNKKTVGFINNFTGFFLKKKVAQNQLERCPQLYIWHIHCFLILKQ